jgi:hypothetical protein
MKHTVPLLLLFLTLASGLSASDYPTEGVIGSDKVRVRSSPDRTAAVLISLDHGTVVEVLAQSSKPLALSADAPAYWWLQVVLPDGRKGWVHGSLIYLLLADQENQPQNAIEVAGLPGNWRARTYIAPLAPASEEAPEYQYLFGLSGPRGTRNLLVAYPRALAREAQLAVDPNGWLCLTSSDQGWQEWKSLVSNNNGKVVQIGALSHGRGEPDVAISVELSPDLKTYSLMPAR